VTEKLTIPATVTVAQAHPRFDTISFARGRRLSLCAPPDKAGLKPSRILMDGVDVTGFAQVGGDAGSRISPIVLALPEPLKWMSYHNFQAVYPPSSPLQRGTRRGQAIAGFARGAGRCLRNLGGPE